MKFLFHIWVTYLIMYHISFNSKFSQISNYNIRFLSSSLAVFNPISCTALKTIFENNLFPINFYPDLLKNSCFK